MEVKDIHKRILTDDIQRIGGGYDEAVHSFTELFCQKNQLPMRTDGKIMYPMDRTLLENRILHKVKEGLDAGLDISPTYEGIEHLVATKIDNGYNLMLNQVEEHFLIQEYQTGEYETKEEIIRIMLTFLSPRIHYIYRKFEKAVGSYGAGEDVAQEMVYSVVMMMDDFNLSISDTIGLHKSFFDVRICTAIKNALAFYRPMSMAHETWDKVAKFVATEEDHKLPRDVVKKKYACSASLVDIMFAITENGELMASYDYTPQDEDGDKTPSFGEMLPNKDTAIENLELEMTLKSVLTDEEYKIILMRMNNVKMQDIAEALGYKSKRTVQYAFLKARDKIEKAFNVDTTQYAKGSSKKRRKQTPTDAE